MRTVNDVEINLCNGKAAQMPSTRKIYVLCTVIPFLFLGRDSVSLVDG